MQIDHDNKMTKIMFFVFKKPFRKGNYGIVNIFEFRTWFLEVICEKLQFFIWKVLHFFNIASIFFLNFV